MTFISYAQNYEDVMLWRALKEVDKGFYVDVGANDPVSDSVTKAFYDRGWRGINIDPVDSWFQRLQAERKEDINLKVACGETFSSVSFFDIVGTGLSTMEKEILDVHKDRNFKVIEFQVEQQTLTSILDKHAKPDIHFIKIDVEGAEEKVLKGLDLIKFRPWIIIIESTIPNSPFEAYASWEGLITKFSYEFVYFDGLNRYYLSKEHEHLKERFSAPPNYFDFFIHHKHKQLEDNYSTLVEENNLLNNENLKLTNENLKLKDENAKFLDSLSWKITKPLRLFKAVILKCLD